MSEILSFTERRNAKIRDRLIASALRREAVILETRAGPVRADRLICRDHAVEVVNSWGEGFVIGYGDIREVRSGIAALSTVNAPDDRVPNDFITRREPSRVLVFARPGRRR
jgi:hypothetical protein